MVTTPTIFELMEEAVAAGISVIPIDQQTKRPAFSLLPRGDDDKPTWNQFAIIIADAEWLNRWRGAQSYAIVCGSVSGSRLTLDFETERFYDAWKLSVGSLADGLPVMKTGGGGRHVSLRCPNPGGNQRLAWEADESEPAGRVIAIETRGEGGYAIGPGSMHPTGNRYETIEGDPFNPPMLSQAHADALLNAARSLCEAPYTKQQIEKATAAKSKSAIQRAGLNGQASVIDEFIRAHDLRTVLERFGYRRIGDRMLRPNADPTSEPGISIFKRKTDGVEVAYAHSTNDQLWDQHSHDAFSVVCELEFGGDSKKAVRELAGRMGLNRKEGSPKEQPSKLIPSSDVTSTDKPASVFKGPPILLENPIPPSIPAGLIAGPVGDFVEALAIANETPMELGISNVLGVLGTVCQKKFHVQVEPGYKEQLSIFVASAMEPGNRKTSVYMSAVYPLIEWERERGIALEDDIKAAESVVKTAKARIESLRAKAAKAEPGQYQSLVEEIQTLEKEMPVVPNKPRLFTDDVTPEHAGTMMAANGGCISILADEGGIINTALGRYASGVPNVDIFNKGFSGSAVRVDRGSRPSVFIDRPAVTIGLCPQPIIFQQIAGSDVMRLGGFLDRFLLTLPTSKLGYRKLEQNPVPASLSAAYRQIILDLANVQPQVNENGEETPHTLTLADEAWSIWKDWQREVESMLRESGRLSHMRGWGGKIAGTTARLAGLLHCAELSFRAVAQTEIEPDTMQRAVKLARLFTDHAVIAFEAMGADTATDAATALWRVIQKLRAEEVSARDAWHPLRGRYKRVIDVEGGFQKLCDHNLIAEVHTADTDRKGRPSRIFRVHPDIAGDWQ